MRLVILGVLFSVAILRAENFLVVRTSSGEVPVGTVLELRYIPNDPVYTNGQYSARRFTSVSYYYTNVVGEVVLGTFPRAIFWDKTEPYVWDFGISNRYQSATGFITVEFLDNLP